MKVVITGADHIFGPWLREQTGGGWEDGQGKTIGLADESGICAATFYQAFNGASVMMHCAGLGRRWLTREFLWYSFYYPFMELNAKVIISPVESWNTDCIRFIEHIGFKREATLLEASPKGDLIIFTMRKTDCRWLHVKRSKNGQAQSTSST